MPFAIGDTVRVPLWSGPTNAVVVKLPGVPSRDYPDTHWTSRYFVRRTPIPPGSCKLRVSRQHRGVQVYGFTEDEMELQEEIPNVFAR